MPKTIDMSKHLLFRYKDENDLFVAIPARYKSVIDAAKEEFGNTASIPPMKTVRGIFAKRFGNRYTYLDSNMQENDITINRLEPINDSSA